MIRTPRLAGLGSAVLLLSTLTTPTVMAAESKPAEPMPGQALAFETRKGNCLACHMIEGGSAPGGIGPPLVAMKVRFPEREKLRAQIWDATVANPESMMPPFGKHGVLTETEIDQITDFIWLR